MLDTIDQTISRIEKLNGDKKGKKIAIVGAGMAGLTAAYELSRMGHEVVIFEASERVGGRAFTARHNDQYHEYGAMRFPKEHDHTRYYATLCGLHFATFINHHGDEDTFYFIKGIRCRQSEWNSKLIAELRLSENELKIIHEGPIEPGKGPQLLNLLAFPLENTIREIENNEFDLRAILGKGPMTHRIREFDKMSLGQYLRTYLDTPDALELIGTITGLEDFYDRAVSMFIREEFVARDRLKTQGIDPGMDEIVGGTDLLSKILAEKVSDQGVTIHLKHEVFAINNQGNHIRLEVRKRGRDENQEELAYDFPFVICTAPFPVVRRMKLTGVSDGKRRAIRNISYASSTKVLIFTSNRFWENTTYRIKGGASQFDLVNSQLYYPSYNAPMNKALPSQMKASFLQINTVDKGVSQAKPEKPGVLVGSYCWGPDAVRLGALPSKEREKLVVDCVATVHPEILEPGMVQKTASICWDTAPWAGGAFSFMKPGELPLYYEDAIKPEGNLLFAGEHCSIDNGWIQGAITSSLSAVRHIVQQA
ncbi:flavin monoamine oxidase family protein [Persicitalea sp.]|uniref:flavin monoamine oxidase family protein n=1 Tax=Persicitalea sp. TaxID=3100273 RepID=UPI0035938874